MSKRCSIHIHKPTEIFDEYGGHSEDLVLERTIHGVIVRNVMNIITNQQGSQLETVTWLKVHNKIDNPTEKVLVIDGVHFRIANIINNIGNRHFYQIEKLTGGM